MDVKDIKNVGSLIVAARDGFESSRDSDKNRNGLKTYSYSSAAKAASKLIAVFPLLTSRTVSADTTQMVSKYIEQKGCIILQLALQAANISNAKNGMDYLRNFHQNLNIGGTGIDVLSKTIDAWIDGFDSNALDSKRTEDSNRAGYRESVQSLSHRLYEDTKEVFDDDIYESDMSLTISPFEMKELLEMFAKAESIVTYDTYLNPVAINDYVVKESDGNYHVMIKPIGLNEARRSTASYSDNTHMRNDRRADGLYDDIGAKNKGTGGYGYDYYKRNRELNDDERQDRINDRNDREHYEDRQYSKEERERQRREHIEGRLNKHNVDFLKDQDIKKMNNAIPSLLVVRFYNDSNATVSTEFIIGVKSKVLGVNSDEILRRIANDNADGKWFLNLMRTMTGELKAADFLFGLSRTNEDLQSIKKRGSQGDVWALLQTRALAAKQAVKQQRLNNYAAITTVVISQDDADELYREENIDLNNPSVARHFMESYNLLGFIIADDSIESLKIMFDDGDKYFEEISYRMLERDTDDTYKKMINLMAKSR